MLYQNAPEPAKGSRRTGLLVVGFILLIGGVAAGIVLYLSSDSQAQDAVKNLQRAPIGCDTEFDFTGTGTFIFYTESVGKIGDLRGDCENTGTDYDHGTDRIRVSLTLTDDSGDEVDLGRSSGISYDSAGFVGTSIRSVDIDQPGTYTLSVESDDSDFAIAVGRNPNEAGDSLKTTAIIVAAAGLVLGLLFILLGLRRKPATGAPTGGSGGFPGNQPGQFSPGQFSMPAGQYPGQYGTQPVQAPPGQFPGQFPGQAPGPYPGQAPGPYGAPPASPPPAGGGWGAPNA
ncbi:MAG: hypothetical protein ABIR32_06675 [Ilumatobacteraceae bacterium]